MKTNKKAQKTPAVKSLNGFLIFLLVASIASIGFIVYLAYTNLTSSTKAANEAISKIQKENAPLKNTDQIIAQNATFADILQITPRLSVSASEVQPVLTSDINKYARLTGIRIANTTYGKDTPVDTSSGQTTTQEGDSGGANTVKIEASNAVPMRSVLQFIKLVENNLPIMYVTEISLEGTDTQDVKIASMTIGVQTQ